LTQADGINNTTVYEYNVMNKLTKKIDNGGRTGSSRSYTYDNAKVEYYDYYGNGDMKTKIDRNGKCTYYIYDCHHRMLSQTIDTSSVSYTYDNNGNTKTMTDSTGTTQWFYDEQNRATAKTVPNFGTTNFAYDIITGLPAGYYAETTTDYKANVTKKVYDKVGRIYQVTADGKTTTYDYYSNGNKKSVTSPDNTKQEYTYYKDNLLYTFVTKKPDSSIMDFYSYTYDDAHIKIKYSMFIQARIQIHL
jgi:YD repeat-containing protein